MKSHVRNKLIITLKFYADLICILNIYIISTQKVKLNKIDALAASCQTTDLEV